MHSLAQALKKNGYKISLVISRELKSAKIFAEKFSIPKFSNDLEKIPQNISVFFLAVQDNQIKKTADLIAKSSGKINKKLFIHLSGAEDISSLISLKKKGADTASFHIMQTFPSKKIVNIKNAFAAVETESKPAEKFLFKLAEDLNLKPFPVKSENKNLYHLAGVFASNFLTGNLFNSKIIFDNINTEINYADVLTPIIKKTMKNIQKFGPVKSLSGPVERGDLATIKNHIKVLKKLSNINPSFKPALSSYLIQSLTLLNISGMKKEKINEADKKLELLLKHELKAVIDFII